MPIEFAYAQARAQARHGERLSQAAWRLLESSGGLSQFLHSARATPLAPLVEHFTPGSSPHAIERSLRREWRAEVDNVSHWAPAAWRQAVAWVAWLSDLPVIAELRDGGRVLPWMVADPVLSGFARADPDARLRAIDESGVLAGSDGDPDPFESWLQHWLRLWPESRTGHEPLSLLVKLIRAHRDAMGEDSQSPAAAQARRDELERRVVRLLRTRVQEPVTLFCHLLLTGLELWRLRNGLIRRSLFNDVAPGG